MTTNSVGFSPIAVFLCLLAAGCSTLRGTLLLLGTVTVILLSAGVLVRLFHPPIGAALLSGGLLGTAIAGVIHLAVLAVQPLWWADVSPLFYVIAFLSGGVTTQETAWTEDFAHFGKWAAVLLLIGGAREWLSVGKLMGIRVFWDGASLDFAYGGLGLITAALLLAVCGLRYRWCWQYTPAQGIRAGAALFLISALSGIVYTLLSRFSLPAHLTLLCAAALVGVMRVSLQWLTHGALPFSDFVLSVIAFSALLCLPDHLVWWQAMGTALGYAAIAGVAVAVGSAIATRLDAYILPARAKTSPILLATAGIAVYAFGAF